MKASIFDIICGRNVQKSTWALDQDGLNIHFSTIHAVAALQMIQKLERKENNCIIYINCMCQCTRN
jgi:hypothetical protein